MQTLNCTEAQSTVLVSGVLKCRDAPWKCAELYPQYGDITWTVDNVTHLCVRLVADTPSQNNSTNSSNACPTGYKLICGVSCICASLSGGGTLTPGANATNETGGGPSLGGRQGAGATVCSNDFECFWVDQLPYALVSTLL